MPISNPFTLPAGFNLRLSIDAIRKANLTVAQFGNNAQPTPFGINLMTAVLADVGRRVNIAGAGYASLSIAPTIAGNIVTVPRQYATFAGQLALLEGATGAGLAFDFTANAAGQYAVVAEWYEAPVIPSTTTGLPPTQLPGVSSANNKSTSASLFPAGNVDRVNSGGDPSITDANLVVGTTVQAQRFGQLQYRFRVIADVTLTGLQPLASGSATVYGANSDDPSGASVRAVDVGDPLPSTLNPKSTDGYFYAAKLMVVTRTVGGVIVYDGDSIPGANVIGQPPVKTAPSRDKLNSSIFALTGQVTTLNNRVNDLTTVVNNNAVTAASDLAFHINASPAHTAVAISTNPPATGFFAGIANTQAAITALYGFVGSLNQPRPFDTGSVVLGPGGALASLVSTNLTLSGQYANRRIVMVVNTFNVMFAGGQVKAQVGINGSYATIGEADNTGVSPNDQQRSYGGTQLLQFGGTSTIGQNVTVRLTATTGTFDVYNNTRVYISVYTID